jgi:hypothetical protein
MWASLRCTKHMIRKLSDERLLQMLDTSTRQYDIDLRTTAYRGNNGRGRKLANGGRRYG